MKKILLSISIFALFIIVNNNGAYAFNYYEVPNAGNMNVRPLMQHQMEKQETLDFINRPEEYKQKREEKNAQHDYQEGKTQINPYLKPTSFGLGAGKNLPAQKPMEFTTDENGQIKIQGIK